MRITPTGGFVRRTSERLDALERDVDHILSRLRALFPAAGRGRPGFPLNGRVEGPFLCRLVTAGPNAEANYSDERYWVKSAHVSNTTGDSRSQITLAYQSSPALLHVTATNLSELTDHTHLLGSDDKVWVWRVFGAEDPPVPHYVFWREPYTDDDPQDVAATPDKGTAPEMAHGDHVHRGVASFAKTAGAKRYGDISLTEGSGVTITDNGDGTFTITASGGGGGVSSLNTLTGDLTIDAGTGIDVSDNGTDTITVTNTGMLSLTADDSDAVSGQATITGAGTCSTSADPTTNTITITADQEVPDNPATGAILEYDTANGRQWQTGGSAGDILVFDGTNWGLFTPEGKGDGAFTWDDTTNAWSISASSLPSGDAGDLLRHDGTDWQAWDPTEAGELIYAGTADSWAALSPPKTGGNPDGALLQFDKVNGVQWLKGSAGDILIRDSDGWTVLSQPGSDGDYVLKCSVSAGAATFSWEEAAGDFGQFVPPEPGAYDQWLRYYYEDSTGYPMWDYLP